MCVAAMCAIAAPAAAQVQTGDLRSRPHVAVTFATDPEVAVGTLGDRFGIRTVGATAAVPIFGEAPSQPLSDRRTFRLLLDGGFHAASSTLPFVVAQQTLSNGKGGVTGIHGLNRTNALVWSVDLGFAQARSATATTTSGSAARLLGRATGVHRQSESLTLIYGADYSYTSGKGRVVPVLGVQWRPNLGSTSIRITAPFDGVVLQRLNARVSVGGRVALQGNQYKFANNGQFPGNSDSLALSLREVRAGADASVRMTSMLFLVGEAGASTVRHLGAVDKKTEIYVPPTRTSPYFRIGLRLSLSTNPPWDDLLGSSDTN